MVLFCCLKIQNDFSGFMLFDRYWMFFILSLLVPVLEGCDRISSSNKNVVKKDLTRILKNKELKCSSDTNQEIETFRHHWKKNPGRYSELDLKDRWKNVQLTLYTDEFLFINESQDSLFVPAGGECILKLEEEFCGDVLRFYATSLSKGTSELLGEGELQIFLDDKKIFEQNLKPQKLEWNPYILPLEFKNVGNLKTIVKTDLQNPEIWNQTERNKEKNCNPGVFLKIRWSSKTGAGLFLGSPYILEKRNVEKKNVILIVIDALRQDSLSSGGSPFPTTPILDSFSKDSIIFKKTIANGNWTKPSMISFFTSEIASNLGLGNAWFYTSAQQRKIFYSKKPFTLPNAFRKEGYFTESIMNNVFLMDYTSVGVDLGFHKIQQVGKDNLDTEELVSRAETFFRDHKEDLFFLHLNLNTPHWGYRPPSQFLQELKKNPIHCCGVNWMNINKNIWERFVIRIFF